MKKNEIKGIIDEFLQEHPIENIQLILDSTGPSLTKHYLVLGAIGEERLSLFQNVHTFSGGTFAYLGYKAAAGNLCRFEMDEYYKNIDKKMRLFHRGRIPLVHQLINYQKNKSFYNSMQPMEETIAYIFSDRFLERSIDCVDSNFIAYYGFKDKIVSCSKNSPLDAMATLFDVIRYSVNIPFLYGKQGMYSDPAFHRNYRKTLSAIRGDGSAPSLVITPWKSGRQANCLYLNPFLPSKQKLLMTRDIFCLLANIPNRSYGRDLAAVFGTQS